MKKNMQNVTHNSRELGKSPRDAGPPRFISVFRKDKNMNMVA